MLSVFFKKRSRFFIQISDLSRALVVLLVHKIDSFFTIHRVALWLCSALVQKCVAHRSMWVAVYLRRRYWDGIEFVEQFRWSVYKIRRWPQSFERLRWLSIFTSSLTLLAWVLRFVRIIPFSGYVLFNTKIIFDICGWRECGRGNSLSLKKFFLGGVITVTLSCD